MATINPFLLKGYAGEQYFCDRVEESQKIINSIHNQQDLTLYAYRRLGKSALIRHVATQMEADYHFVYADIWGTSSLSEFVKELTNSIIKSNVFSQRGLGKKLQDFVKSLGTSFTIGHDGMPSIDLTYNDKSKAFKNLDEIIGFLNAQTKPVVLAIDEFQEIRKYDSEDTPIEAVLRKLTQQSNNIRFIYSGSEFHLLNDIFNSYNRPFYQSTRMIEIGPIEHDIYKEFILHHFKRGNKSIESSLVDEILKFTYRHTFYVQSIFNHLYSLSKQPKNWTEFEKIYHPFIMEKGVFYSELPNRVTPQQFVITKAFAKAGRVSSPTGNVFLDLAGLTNASSMKRAVQALLDKQILIKEGEDYRLYDVFLEHYLNFNKH